MQALGSISKIISLSKLQIWIVGGYFLITALSGFLTLTTLHGEFIVMLFSGFYICISISYNKRRVL